MHGTKPEQTIDRQPDEALSRLSIQAPVQQNVEPQPQPAAQPSYKPESARRFEAILKKELEGTSFSSDVEHQTRLEARLAAKHESVVSTAVGTAQRARTTPLRPLTRSKALATPFEGETILDKLISFMAHILKSLERRISRSFKRIFIPKRTQSKVQRLQELKKKEELARKEKSEKSSKLAAGRGGASKG